jgi:hypothetical protein
MKVNKVVHLYMVPYEKTGTGVKKEDKDEKETGIGSDTDSRYDRQPYGVRSTAD